ncbi:MAG: extracellular solute-binding protein [Anaerolineales bacterium]|nr:extracellular solute-binding protein [Anaerolineales bacterium]
MPTPRSIHIACLTLLAAFVFSACGPAFSTSTPTLRQAQGGDSDLLTGAPSATPTPTTTPTPAPQIEVTPDALRGIRIQVWHAFNGPAADVFTTQLAQFNTLNQWGIVVYQTAYGDYSTLFASVNSALATSRQPDLVVALPEQALTWEAKDAVVDLNPYVFDPTWGLTANEIADIPAAFWMQDQVDGQRLGVPAQRTARFLFYNQTWARELGFTRPPATAKEFRTQACAANQSKRQDVDPGNDGKGGWIVDADPLTALSWLLAFEGGVTATDGKGYAFASPPNQAALEFLKGLYDDHCAWLSTAPTPYEQFAIRSALVTTGSLAEVSLQAQAMSAAGNVDDWTVLPFPGPNGAALVTSGSSYTLLQSAPEKQLAAQHSLAAWLFVRWLLTPENQAKWVEATGLLPLRFSALDYLGKYRTDHPQWNIAVGYIPEAQGTPQLASWRMAQHILGDGTEFIFRTNLAVEKIPSVLEEMDATAEEISNQ